MSVRPRTGAAVPHATRKREVSSPFAIPAEQNQDALMEWVEGIDAGNWRSYLEIATSEQARDRQFLDLPSVESLLLLRRLGEIAPEETIRSLNEKKFLKTLPEVVDGWARVAPREAFESLLSRRLMISTEIEGACFGRAVAVMFATDPQAVLNRSPARVGEYPCSLSEGVANALPRYAGVERVEALLESRWDDVAGDLRTNWGRAGEFTAWSEVYTRSLLKSGEPAVQTQQIIERSERLLARENLNPQVRGVIEHQLAEWRKMAAGTNGQ
ncbi:hypothetical protein OKA05_03120 [Luteolibacter arcticus]|uniref:ERAP1-like C-terminal domain-containing protein n=1 Tax=Luteolibacter arcticus TaxID=1581411 RepID=A0ABT3GE29_9BACT|nr:hypothetical protein [Luteolibacter arcticus]MCW1921528.1 hypothetical protein [Luteolibacter arcticus]